MKKVLFNVLSLIVLIVFTGIFGCKKEQKIPYENGYYLPANITHFPTEEGELKNVQIYHDTTNIDSLKLVFSGAKPTYKANDILVGTEGSGYLAKVISDPVVRGDTLIIKTVLAKFTEAFEDAYIDTVIQVKPQEKMKMNLKAVDTTYTETFKGKSYNIHLKYDAPLFSPGKNIKSEKYGFCWTFPNIKLEIENSANNAAFSLSADTLIVSKGLSIDFKLDLEWFQIKRVRFVKIEDEGFRFVGLKLEGKPIDKDCSIPLLNVPALVAIPVGPIVLTVGFKIKLGSNVHISAEAKWDCVVSYTQHTEIGGDWYDGIWHNVYEKNITPTITLEDIFPTLSGYIEVEAPYIDVIGDISLYSVIGPEFYIRPFPYFNLDIPSSMSQVNYEYGGGVEGGVKLALTLFDIPILNFTLAEYRMKLGEGTYIPNNPPNIPATPLGPTSGGVNFAYSFTSSTTDPEGDNIAIRFDWGDGDTSLWSSYVASGDSVSMSHSYINTGTYLIKAQAKDTNNAVSDWSSGHQIAISSSPTLDTLVNDDGLPVGAFNDLDYYAERFTPTYQCSLKKAMIAFYVPADSPFVSQLCSLFVWNNANDSTPDNRLALGTFQIPTIPSGSWAWVIADLSSFNLFFSTDFWIGYKKITLRPPFGISDGTSALANRNMYTSDPQSDWNSWIDGDFLIRAIVAYSTKGIGETSHKQVSYPRKISVQQGFISSILNGSRNEILIWEK